MKLRYLSFKDLLFILPLSAVAGYALARFEFGSILKATLVFGSLIFLGMLGALPAIRWSGGGRSLWWMVALGFTLRLAAGVWAYHALPVDGYEDPDDRSGFIFTDAHNRDAQAWQLADIDNTIWEAFSRKYHSDQYGGLLALSALAYRYLSLDIHRPLLLVLLSALVAALGIPFLWKAAHQLWGESVARISGWLFTLYPESVFLGGAVMREPYLMTFSAISLWGFVEWRENHSPRGWFWMGLALLGMLLVSPAIAVVTIVIFMGWMWFTREHKRFSWRVLFGALGVLFIGLILLALALNRTGSYGNSLFAVLVNWTRDVIFWENSQAEQVSGWLQKLFVGRPPWFRIGFMTIYGLLQPVLPAAFFEPTTWTWHIIGILRALGWYALLPVLILSFVAAAGQGSTMKRRVWMWFSLLVWTWFLFASLRGGGDQWDNPRYRAILFLWQAVLAAYTLVWQRETRSPWLWRILAMEAIFLLFFGQWYANRYFQFGGQLPFGLMVGLILIGWLIVFVGGLWRDRTRRA